MYRLLFALPAALFSPAFALAQTFTGPGYGGGASVVNTGGGDLSVRAAILNLLFTALSFLGLLAVVVLVIVSIMLAVSLGDDAARERAQKVFLYVAIGFIVIVLSDALVYWFISIGLGSGY